jgi:hypothetical protein
MNDPDPVAMFLNKVTHEQVSHPNTLSSDPLRYPSGYVPTLTRPGIFQKPKYIGLLHPGEGDDRGVGGVSAVGVEEEQDQREREYRVVLPVVTGELWRGGSRRLAQKACYASGSG